MRFRDLIFGWSSPLTFPLVPGWLLWFGGGSTPAATPAAPPAAPAPSHASTPTQSVSQILNSQAPRKAPKSILTQFSTSTAYSGKRTILGTPIA